MSWVSNLVDTYDRVSGIAGIADGKGKALLPMNHMMMKTDISITLGIEGVFRHAESSAETVLIPCTEDSSSRTSSAVAHPLHDNLSYLAKDEARREKYLNQLDSWRACHAKAEAVYRYVSAGTILADLQESGIETESEKVDKLFVRFSVETGLDDLTPKLWEDKSFISAWQKYCKSVGGGNETLCYATGKVSPGVSKHPKGINPSTNGAKLISCNDETNFTYKGRFVKAEQANAVSGETSHKAHAMLKYLIAVQNNKCDSQAVAVWALDTGNVMPNPFKDSYWLVEEEPHTDGERLAEAHETLETDYAKKFRNLHYGVGNVRLFEKYDLRAVVMAVDAATTGRMAITFYQDLEQNEYIDRLIAWHMTCKYCFRYEGRDIIQAPSADRIIAAVYGEPKGEGYNKIKKQARIRLLGNIVCGEPFDRAWVIAAANRVSNPFSYDKQDGGWDKFRWENALNVACAMIRKYHNDQFKKKNDTNEEVFSLEIDKMIKDRSYLFGRLLAVADRLESYARYLQIGKDDTEKRPTNAVRYMTAFSSKPVRTWKIIYEQIIPYIMQLKGADKYQQILGEIMQLLFLSENFTDDPLDGKYLLGYSLQCRELNKALFEKKEKKEKKEEVSNESDE